MKYGTLNLGQIEAMVNKLGGMDGVAKFLSGEIIVASPVTEATIGTSLPIWKTIKLGTGPKTVKDFRRALEKDGCRVSDWVTDLLGKPAFSVAKEQIEVDLVKVTVAELGFPNGATVHDIYEAAFKLDLVRCPNEVGPQLRLQYLDQPMGEWILVGMDPIAGSGGYLGVFRAVHDGDGRWLNGFSGHSGGVCDDDDSWVFVLPRK